MDWTIDTTTEAGCWLVRCGEIVDSRWYSAGAAQMRHSQLATQRMAMTAAAGDADPTTGRPFYAVLCVDEFQTTDGRYFEHFEWETLPLSLWTLDQNSGHYDGEASGSIRTIERLSDNRRIFATGFLLPTDEGTQTEAQIEGGALRFISVDPADYECEEEITAIGTDGWPIDGQLRFTKYVIGGATVLGSPAIRLAVIWLDGMDAPAELTMPLPDPVAPTTMPTIVDVDDDQDIIVILASASGSTSLPLSARGAAWDSSSAKAAVAKWASSDGTGDKATINWPKYGRAFFHKEGDGTKIGDFSLPFADVVGGELTAIWAGVTSAAGACSGARGADGGKFADAKPRIGTYYAKAAKQYSDDGIKVPWASNALVATIAEGELQTLLASAREERDGGQVCVLTDHCGGPALPTLEMFREPGFDGPTPPTVDRDGWARGHFALWNVPHRGFLHYEWSDRIYAPHSLSGYAQFQVGSTPVACCDDPGCGHEERRSLRTGVLTVGTTHAGKTLTAAAAQAFYENSGLQVADVVLGEDQWGPWFSGPLRPDISDARVRELLGSTLSGDWRWIAGQLELVAILGVNTGGIPVLASAHVEGGETRTLIAGWSAPAVPDEALVASITGGLRARAPQAAPERPGEPQRARLASGTIAEAIEAALGPRLGRIEGDLALLRPLAAERLEGELSALLDAGAHQGDLGRSAQERTEALLAAARR